MIRMLRVLAAFVLTSHRGAAPAAAQEPKTITGTSVDGVTRQLELDRTPALFTGDFGDCMGGKSLFNITKFDAAYYTDNSTVLFHLDGQSTIETESLILHFFMEAYGQDRFQMTFDPCFVNIKTLCPLNASVPVKAFGVFVVGAQQVGDVPNIAFEIPDFEGFVRLQIFGNSTRSEIGCFQASLRNGHTFSHPKVVSPILGIFTLAAMISSFATSMVGDNIPSIRTHYAHSLSSMIIFETFQSIFFSGALQLDFPSVLPAWWSNFAWAAGQIYNSAVVRAADISSGVRGAADHLGSIVNADGSSVADNGASLVQKIYGESLPQPRDTTHMLSRRYNASDPFDYDWAGSLVSPGLPVPGSTPGFPTTLAVLNIPATNVLAIGLIWLMALLGLLILILASLKGLAETLAKYKRIKENRLAFFRTQWVRYTIVTIMRTLFAAFAMIMTLSFYELTVPQSAGGKVLAAIFFLVFLFGVGGLVVHACRVRLKNGRYTLEPDKIVMVRRTFFKYVPYIFVTRVSTLEEVGQPEDMLISIPFCRVSYQERSDPKPTNVHEDGAYIKTFGWLSARYRRTRWWYFACYLGYQLIRAAIVGGGSATPTAQVSCLLVYDLVAFLTICKLDPYEGRRNTALAVWMLGLSKLLTTALSVTFLPSLSLDRLITTATGVIIIVIQGLLTIAVLLLTVLTTISTFFSVTSDRATADFQPVRLQSAREHYLTHLAAAAPDDRLSRTEKARLKAAEREAAAYAAANPPPPSFDVHSVRRVTRIYDEEEVDATSMVDIANRGVMGRPGPSRRCSTASTHSLPRGARPYRASWTSVDFAEAAAAQRVDSVLVKRLSGAYYGNGSVRSDGKAGEEVGEKGGRALDSFVEEDEGKYGGLGVQSEGNGSGPETNGNAGYD